MGKISLGCHLNFLHYCQEPCCRLALFLLPFGRSEAYKLHPHLNTNAGKTYLGHGVIQIYHHRESDDATLHMGHLQHRDE